MVIAFKGLSAFLLAYWPVLAVTSVMMFGGPGASNEKSKIRNVILVLYYPLLITAIYWLADASLLGISGAKLFVSSAIIVTAGVWALGYFRLAWNACRGINNEGYSIAGGAAYYDAQRIKGVDTLTFRPAGDKASVARESGCCDDSFAYYLDEHRVYFRGKAVHGVDPRSFRKITQEPSVRSADYWRDDKVVVYDGQRLEGSDPDDVQILPGYYLRSGANIYHAASRLANADVSTFEVINPFLAKDKQRIYYGHSAILPEADAPTFRLADPDQSAEIAVDQHCVYLIVTAKNCRALKQIDRASMVILNDGNYIKDKNVVYHVTGVDILPLTDADPATFKTVPYSKDTPWNATDGEHCWCNGKRIR